MVASLCLLSCVLATAQPGPVARPVQPPYGSGGFGLHPPDTSPGLAEPQPEGAEQEPLGLRLSPGQELIYRGLYTEETTGNGVEIHRAYRLESRVFVLSAPARAAEVAFLTIFRLRDEPSHPGQPAPGSVRLELARVDSHGRLQVEAGRSLAVPLEGPPTVECGAFVELPSSRPTTGTSWEVKAADGRLQTWRLAGLETVNATSCWKLDGVEQSDDWDEPRGDRTGWRRHDTVWLSPRLGFAYRVERVIERRDPARGVPNHRALLRYELESNVPYPPQLYTDRRNEILQARTFADAAAPLLATPNRYTNELEALMERIEQYLQRQPTPTPYREATLQVKRRVQAAQHGEAAPAPVVETTAPLTAPAVATIGAPAPDFLATNFTRRDSARLRQWLGRPIVLVFYRPESFQAEEVLRFGQQLVDDHPGEVTVLGLAVSGDAEKIGRQRDSLQLTFPLLDGSGLRTSYAVEETPTVVVVDAAGIVRSSYVGWGQELPASVAAEVKHLLTQHHP